MDLKGNLLKMNNAAQILLDLKDVKENYNLNEMINPKEYDKLTKSFKYLLNKGSIRDFEIEITTNFIYLTL